MPHDKVVIAALFHPLFEFFYGTDDDLFASVLTSPYRKRRRPVPLARDCPVLHIRKPLPHSAVADVLRLPVYFLVFRKKFPCKIRHADVPRVARVIDERGLASPAERIRMLMLSL